MKEEKRVKEGKEPFSSFFFSLAMHLLHTNPGIFGLLRVYAKATKRCLWV